MKVFPEYPIQAVSPFEKRFCGYFTPNGTTDPVVVCNGKDAVVADYVSTGTWDLTLAERVQKILDVKAHAVDDGTDIVEIQVLAYDEDTQIARVRCRRATDLASVLAVSNTCDRIAFEFVTLKSAPPGSY